MEAAQRALRQPDYDSDDDVSSVEMNSTTGYSSPPPSSQSHSTSIRQRGSRNIDPEAFDPYAPIPDSTRPPSQDALFDATAFELSSMMMTDDDTTRVSKSSIPGGAGYLEIEEEPPRPPPIERTIDNDQPIQTSSGLLLTHRRSPTNNNNSNNNRGPNHLNSRRPQRRDNFEMEYGIHGNPGYGSSDRHASAIAQARHLLSYAKVWIVVCFGILLVMTGALMHSFGHQAPNSTITEMKNDNAEQQQQQQYYQNNDFQAAGQLQNQQQQYPQNVDSSSNTYYQVPENILLLPMDDISQLSQQQQQQPQQQHPRRRMLSVGHHHDQQHEEHHHRGHHALDALRKEFESWVSQHKKQYHSDHEKEHRFHIWAQNHQKTEEKNRRLGLSKLTKKAMFGSNHLKDLTPEEFRGKYLTGYNGPRTDEIHLAGLGRGFRRLQEHQAGKALDPKKQKAKIHETVMQRMLQQQPVMTSKYRCKWYDVSCMLRWLYSSSGMQFGIIGTMEPKYDADAYPNAVDWRESGAITEVRYQGDCGACWAITAVETVESAHYIGTGDLYDLSEGEVITCETSCSMCDGGWPQNAFQWVMDHGGLPLASSFEYDSYTLVEMTSGLNGESNYWTEDTISDQRSQVCPADSGSNSHNSGDQQQYDDDSSQARYGNIEGYGYATDRCVCYSDGSGCDCDDQDEGTAVRNVASYGPAVVCLDASVWQDYSGGIITSDIECGSGFMDMNHCVQVVGYAYTDDEDNEDGDDNNSKSGGSRDESQREGYWIVRNQWGSNWGMYGYAYVAMGENTCGILNDMTQAYL
eukprot:scaffold1900_cov123-Cylindrotheca_fusiformis.AAC.39